MTSRARGLERYRLQQERRPAWFEVVEVRAVYAKSKRYGPNWEVDHIVPLNHPLVCGLHCADNLQVLHKLRNRKKGNYEWPDMPMAIMSLPLEVIEQYQMELAL